MVDPHQDILDFIKENKTTKVKSSSVYKKCFLATSGKNKI